MPDISYVYGERQGRLPIDSKPLKEALTEGVTKCLQQLQKTNPCLLLSATDLKKAERDAIHIPAVAASLASILTKAGPNSQESLDTILAWNTSRQTIPALSERIAAEELTRSLECRLRQCLVETKQTTSTKPTRMHRVDHEVQNQHESEHDDEASIRSISDLPWKPATQVTPHSDDEATYSDSSLGFDLL